MLKICQLTSPNIPPQPIAATIPDLSPSARELLIIARKPLQWLRHVSVADLAAHRTQEILSKLLDRTELRIAQFENSNLTPIHIHGHDGGGGGGPSGSSNHNRLPGLPQVNMDRHNAMEQHTVEMNRALFARDQHHERSRFAHQQFVEVRQRQEMVGNTHKDDDRRWMQITMGPSPGNTQVTMGPGGQQSPRGQSGGNMTPGSAGEGGGVGGGFTQGWDMGRR